MKAKKIVAAISAIVSVSMVFTVGAKFELLDANVDPMTAFTYEEKDGRVDAWAHLVNANNPVSIYSPNISLADDTRDVIIKFDATGVDKSYSALPGFIAYADFEDDGEDVYYEASVWGKAAYDDLFGKEYEVIIDKDGSYQMVVPLTEALRKIELDDTAYLTDINILEFVIYDAGTALETGGMKVTVTDIVESPKAHTIDEALAASGLVGGDSAPEGTDSPETKPADTDSAKTDSENIKDDSNGKGSPYTGVESVAFVTTIGVLAVGIVVFTRKKK